MTEPQGPSVFELKNFITGHKIINFCMLNDKVITGTLLWHDKTCLHITDDKGKEITLLKSAIAYYSAIN